MPATFDDPTVAFDAATITFDGEGTTGVTTADNWRVGRPIAKWIVDVPAAKWFAVGPLRRWSAHVDDQ